MKSFLQSLLLLLALTLPFWVVGSMDMHDQFIVDRAFADFAVYESLFPDSMIDRSEAPRVDNCQGNLSLAYDELEQAFAALTKFSPDRTQAQTHILKAIRLLGEGVNSR